MMRKIIKSDNGVVGIVVAVLLIGLIVAVVSLIQAVYVPKWMEEREAEHMEQVVTQFAQLKSAIDTHVANAPKIIPIASPITLGNKELPYLMSLRAYGSLEILNNLYSHYNIIVHGDSDLNESFGIIKYSSMNGYYIDQSFIYENGAFITNQREGNMISMRPSISVENGDNIQDVIINFTMVNITPIGGKTNGGGYGTTSILTQYNTNTEEKQINNVQTIEIYTDYYNAWELSINSILKNKIDENKFSINSMNNKVSIEFTNPVEVTLKYKIVEIYAQIGPGWVE